MGDERCSAVLLGETPAQQRVIHAEPVVRLTRGRNWVAQRKASARRGCPPTMAEVGTKTSPSLHRMSRKAGRLGFDFVRSMPTDAT
jgi:hypothetical protein